ARRRRRPTAAASRASSRRGRAGDGSWRAIVPAGAGGECAAHRFAMQDALFEDPDDTPPEPARQPAPARRARARAAAKVLPAPADDGLRALAERLAPRLHMGTSSWHFPGWAGLVWDGEHA